MSRLVISEPRGAGFKSERNRENPTVLETQIGLLVRSYIEQGGYPRAFTVVVDGNDDSLGDVTIEGEQQ